MLLDGHLFRPINVADYVDWGTREEWLAFKNQFVTLFVPFTSLFLGASDQPVAGLWPHVADVEHLRKLYDGGKTRIVVLSEHKESYRALLEERLRAAGVTYHQLLCGVFPNGRMFQSHRTQPVEANY